MSLLEYPPACVHLSFAVAHNAWNGLGITLLTAGMTSLHYLSAPRERQVEDIHYTLINCFSSVLTYCLVAIISPSCDL